MRPRRPAPLLMPCLSALSLFTSISVAQTSQEPAQEADDSSIVPAANVADYCDVEGGRLYYEVFGDGPTIVLIHDGLLHSEVWDSQIGPLSARHKVIRYDRRGYGRSDAPTQPFSNIDDLHALLAHLDVPRAVLIGSSAGGGLAIDYTLQHPDMVDGLVLCGAVVNGLGYSSHFLFRAYGNFDPDLETTLQRWIDDPYSVAPGNDEARARVDELLRANPQNLDFTKSRLEQPPPQAALKRLGEIAVPTLIISGEKDIPDVLAHAGAIEAGIAGSSRIVLKDAGHLCYLEQPEAFNAAVEDFLSLLPLHLRAELEAGTGAETAPPTLDSGLITVNGVTLYVEIMGAGEPLVLLHGFRHDRRTWDGHFQALAQHYRVIRYDLAGHGLSKHPPFTEIGYENLHALLAHLGIDRARFIGHGMGGRICIDFALEYPEMVERLIVVSSGMAGIQLGAPAVQANNAAMIQALRRGDVLTASEYFTRSWTDGPHRPPEEVDPDLRSHCLAMVRHAMEPGRNAGLAAIPDPPPIERLGDLNAPLLVIVGELDQPTVRQIGEILTERIEQARKIEIRGAAHMAHLEKPEEFRRIVRGFLVGM